MNQETTVIKFIESIIGSVAQPHDEIQLVRLEISLDTEESTVICPPHPINRSLLCCSMRLF
jgi:hypothetical protein